MITVSQAKGLRYLQTVYLTDHFDAKGRAAQARVSGKVQLWKTRPTDFKVPVKRGLYDSGYITPSNAARFTLKEPAPRKPKKILKAKPSTPRPYYPEYGIR